MHFTNNGVSRRNSGLFRLALALCAGGVTSTAGAQWVVINLHPAGAVESAANGVFGDRQVGTNGVSSGVAQMWSGSAPSVVRLNPSVDIPAVANAAANGQQGGTITINSGSPSSSSHGAVWSGQAQSVVDLHPSDPGVTHSLVYGMDGATQVGSFAVGGGGTFTAGRPCMWSGTSASWVDLTPAGFATGEARGVFGDQQVGATFDDFFGKACMWYGTAASFVNLNAPEALFSAATCTDGVYQYGVIGVTEPVPGLFPCRWNGTAESWVDMGMPADHWGEVHATHGGFQVGYITDTDQSNERACVWTSGPGTYADLHQFLPPAYTGSNALGVWRHTGSGTTYIVGYALNGGTNQREAVMWVSGPGVNLITSPVAPVDCSAAAGQAMPYTVRILNAGPDTSGPVTLTVTLPPAVIATYASAVPAPTSVTSTQLIFTLPAITGSGAFTDVSITLNAVGAGSTATITAAATTAAEVEPTNNTALASSRIEPQAPTAAAAKGVLSTDATLANSLIPGGAGRYIAFNQPFSSPSGQWWVVRARSNLPAAQDFAIIRSQVSGTPTIAAQEGITVLSHGTLENIDTGAEVNDSGLVAFAGDDNGATAGDRFIATTNGATVTDIVREGQPVPAMPGINYGSSVGASANIFANGQAGFATNSTPATSTAYLSDNGATIIARLNVTAPIGADATIDTMLINTTGVWGLAFDASGAHSIYQADINTGSATNDQVFVADGTVVLQEGVTFIPGLSSTVGGGNKYITMGAGGMWLVRGTNTTAAEDWLIRGSGSTITQTYIVGDPIYAGAAEAWRKDAVSTFTFFSHAADAAGNYIIGGNTTNPDTFANTALVYNNGVVVARENDPVDLDGNGVFDDGVYIRSFDNDSVALISGGLLATVTLRNADAALCHLNNTSVGQALIRIPLPGCGTSDFDGDGDFGTDADIEAFFACLGGNCCATCFFGGADFNLDGDTGTDADIESFFRVLAGGGC